MNLRETRRYEMLVRVRDFGTEHGDAFSASSLGGEMFGEVGKAVTQLAEEMASELSGFSAKREGSTTKTAAREAVREALDSISRTARALAIDTPGLDDKFRLPRGHGDLTLLNAARSFAHDAKPLAKEFTAHGLPETFLDELASEITEFEEAIHEHSSGKEAHVVARVGIDAALDTGFRSVRRLDAIVSNILRDDPKAIAAWEVVRRIERLPRAKNGDEAPAVTAAPPPAAPQATPPRASA